jgi:ribosomal protein L37AE/L43A
VVCRVRVVSRATTWSAADSSVKCPKCGYERRPTDSAPAWQCPSCHVAYVKAAQSQDVSVKPRAQPASPRVRMEPVEAESDELEWLLSRGQKIVIYSILLNLLLRGLDQGHVAPAWVIYVLYFCTAAYSLLGVLKICSGLQKSQGAKILLMVLSYFPLINLIALVYLNVQATRRLREAGWTVGLLGARQ